MPSGSISHGSFFIAVDRIFNSPYSVRDSDGEFMLIEAADDLPSWVTPSVVENRVRTVLKSCLRGFT